MRKATTRQHPKFTIYLPTSNPPQRTGKF
ncbi:unnamed protein product [Spirodela intermedia]|uniref:Uncharacterized protein n=1 Tax=Spirodela intermedia TaxID=51605 RepID=A0A7I8K5X4_SPIIN|nr:unnamed protein product [Spirodela intermedia]